MAPDRAAPLPDWITYPGDAWESITPEEAGLDETAWSRFLADSHVTGAQWEGERHGDGEWGAAHELRAVMRTAQRRYLSAFGLELRENPPSEAKRSAEK